MRDLLKERFRLVRRGRVHIKDKGEMTTYLLVCKVGESSI